MKRILVFLGIITIIAGVLWLDFKALETLWLFLGIIAAPTVVVVAILSWLAFKARREKKQEGDEGTTEENQKKDFWWDYYFKPYFAIPLAWILFQIILILSFPNHSKWILNNYLSSVIGLQVIAIILNLILSKKQNFEERISRKILIFLNVALLIGVCLGIILKAGGFKINRYESFFQLEKASVLQAIKDIEKANTEHRTKKLRERLDNLKKKAEEEGLTDEETDQAREIQKQLIQIYPSSPSFRSSAQPSPRHPPDRPVVKPTGFARLDKQRIAQIPAGQRVIIQKPDGQILRLHKGDYVRLEIVEGQHRHLAFVDDLENQLKPMPSPKAKLLITDIRISDKLILQNTSQKEVKVKIKIN